MLTKKSYRELCGALFIALVAIALLALFGELAYRELEADNNRIKQENKYLREGVKTP
jgi:hypothetical protein